MPITTGPESRLSSRESYKVDLGTFPDIGEIARKLNPYKQEVSTSIKDADKDIQGARDVLPLYKERYIDNNPYADAYERMRTGALAALGRQAEINRAQLQSGLERTGIGANALRRVMARRQLDTELSYRYLDAEKNLAEIEIMAQDKARSALDDYMNAYLKLAQSSLSSASAKLSAQVSNKGLNITMKPEFKDNISTGLVRHIGESESDFAIRRSEAISKKMSGQPVVKETGLIER